VDHDRAGGKLQAELPVPADGLPGHRYGLPDHRGEVERRRLEHLVPAEGEQVLGGGALARLEDLLHVVPHRVVRGTRGTRRL